MNKIEQIISYAESIEDLRDSEKVVYPFAEIFLSVFIAVLSGCNGWDAIEDLCKSRLRILKKLLPFANGVAGHDTLRRAMSVVDPKHFQGFFINWVKCCFGEKLLDKIYAIDGKQAKGSKFAGNPAVHMLNVFATTSGISIAQSDVDKKTNEIVAMDSILDLLDLKGAIITVDALNCQKKLAKKIDQAEGQYLFAVKGNHGYLYNQIIQHFKYDQLEDQVLQYFEKKETGHGRMEIRKYTVLYNLYNIKEKDSWSGLSSIIKVESSRAIKGKTSTEERYYISNINNISAERASQLIRGHWSIENNLHWMLDIAFNEDDCRIVGNAAKNLSVVRQMALNCLRTHKQSKYTIPRMQRNLSFSEEFLDDFLQKLIC